MTEQQLKKANEIHEDIERLSLILNREKLFVGGRNRKLNTEISCILSEDCQISLRVFLIKKLEELEKEFEEL